VSVYKLSFAVIPDLIRYPWFDKLTMTGHPELVEGLDSGLRTAGMTNRNPEFINRL